MSRRRRAHLHIHPMVWLIACFAGLFWPELFFHGRQANFLEGAWIITLGAAATCAEVLRGRRSLRWRGALRGRLRWGRQASAGAVGERNTREIPESVRKYVWHRDGGRCVKCGSTKTIQYDHKVPWSKGGSNTVNNIQLLCQPCNIQKGAAWPADYVQKHFR